jgi:ferredoxin
MPGDDLYRRLQEQLDRLPIPFPATESGVELRILERLFSRDQAYVALALGLVPETATVIAKRLASWPSERVRDTLDRMAEQGLIHRIPLRKGTRYANAPFVVGIYEGQLGSLTPELQRDVEIYLKEGFGRAVHNETTPQMRTVPVNAAIALERHVASYDDIRAFVTSSSGPFAVMDCICRKGREMVGEPCSQTKLRQTCLTLGFAADAMVERGLGRPITRDEMLGILQDADREGLVLQPQNTSDPLFVCCCCGCCCGVLRSAKMFPEPASYFAATYRAAVDAELCAACGVCVERCQMDAIELADDVSTIDAQRCIGCGLCVTTCTAGAIRFEANEAEPAPPSDTSALYMKIYRERFGAVAAAKLVAKAILHKQA